MMKNIKLNEEVVSGIEQLAHDLAEFAYDYDPYGFDDAYSEFDDTKEMTIERAAEDNLSELRENPQGLIEWLQDVIDECEADIEPENSYNQEYIANAKGLIDRIQAFGKNESLLEYKYGSYDIEYPKNGAAGVTVAKGGRVVREFDTEKEAEAWIDEQEKNESLKESAQLSKIEKQLQDYAKSLGLVDGEDWPDGRGFSVKNKDTGEQFNIAEDENHPGGICYGFVTRYGDKVRMFSHKFAQPTSTRKIKAILRRIASGAQPKGEKPTKHPTTLILDSLGKDESLSESVTVYTSDEHASDDNDKHYYGYITIEHPTLGDFCVSCKITGKTEIRTDGYPWRFLQEPKYKLTDAQIEYIKAHEDELKKIARSGKPVSQLKESLQEPVNTKINIRESLNKIDWDTDNKYDLRNMYDASKMEYKDKIELAKKISLNESYENLYSYLKKFI